MLSGPDGAYLGLPGQGWKGVYAHHKCSQHWCQRYLMEPFRTSAGVWSWWWLSKDMGPAPVWQVCMALYVQQWWCNVMSGEKLLQSSSTTLVLWPVWSGRGMTPLCLLRQERTTRWCVKTGSRCGSGQCVYWYTAGGTVGLGSGEGRRKWWGGGGSSSAPVHPPGTEGAKRTPLASSASWGANYYCSLRIQYISNYQCLVWADFNITFAPGSSAYARRQLGRSCLVPRQRSQRWLLIAAGHDI